jgi:hypothetical protein
MVLGFIWPALVPAAVVETSNGHGVIEVTSYQAALFHKCVTAECRAL